MSLEPGHKLGHFEIVEPIGKGGMGEVYRAKDAKLGRDVAIKVLPEEYSRDTERLARFEREAKLLAALNHPHIAGIYGLEHSGDTHYLILELVPGETLAERIRRAPLPIEEALAIASQIADALEAAHETGIVHRDLKPANIKLTEDDVVKVLDFGLAKAFEEEMPHAESSQSPTRTRDATRVGVILGTAAYMSPEQAKGKRVDKRADIFAFGAVVYEMLTGKKAFPGDDVSEVLASVIKLEPDWNALPQGVPSRLLELLHRCLDKDPKKRRRDMGDVRNELDLAEIETPARRPTPSRARVALFGIACLVLGAIGASILFRGNVPDDTRPTMHFATALPEGDRLTQLNYRTLALSPDGRTLAYTANAQIYLRNFGQLRGEALSGTQGARELAFSPDGKWLAFATTGPGVIMKVAVDGGRPVQLWRMQSPLTGLSWGGENLYVGQMEAIVRLDPDGGAPEEVVSVEPGEIASFPHLLPDGDTLLFTFERSLEASIVVQSLSSGQRREVVASGADAMYVPTGHLVYTRDTALYAEAFDIGTLSASGAASPVLDGLRLTNANTGTAFQATFAIGGQYTISQNGWLAYLPGNEEMRRLVWLDRNGNAEDTGATPALYEAARLSPDGDLIALVLASDIWIYDLRRGSMSRITHTNDKSRPVWSPNGRELFFASGRIGVAQVFRKPVDGSAEAEALTTGEMARHPESVSPDGRVLAFHDHHNERGTDILMLSLDGAHEEVPYAQTQYNERIAAFSPNGRWLAFQSDDSGRGDVYVGAYPGSGAKHLVSTEGGLAPRWSADGATIFYLERNRLMSVTFSSDEEVHLGVPEPATARPLTFQGNVNAGSVYNPHEGRFLVIESESQSRGEINIVINWTEELKRLVPVE